MNPISEAAGYSDAGGIEFGPNSRVLGSETVGLKGTGPLGESVYCTAPILPKPEYAISTLQYFAVGRDCCAHQMEFRCGTLMDRGGNDSGSAEEEDPILGGWVLPKRLAAEETGGLVGGLERDLGRGGGWEREAHRRAARGIARDMGRAIAKDAIFIQLSNNPVSSGHATQLGVVRIEAAGRFLTFFHRGPVFLSNYGIC